MTNGDVRMRIVELSPGTGYTVSDHGDAAHRSYKKTDAKMFIID